MTASVFISPYIKDLNRLPDTCRSMTAKAQYFYRNPGAVYFSDEHVLSFIPHEGDFEELANCLDKGDYQRFCDALDRLFGPLIRKGRLYEGTEAILKNLAKLISSARTFYGLSGLSSLNLKETAGLSAIVSSFKRLVEETGTSGTGGIAVSRKLHLAFSFIDAHYHEPISAYDIAHYLGVSTGFLGRLFRKATGLSLLQYITRLRIEKARDLLLSGRYKVYEVARMCGFSTAQYFCKVFKSTQSISPSDYMNRSIEEVKR